MKLNTEDALTSLSLLPGASAICCTAASPPEWTNWARPDGSFASTFPAWNPITFCSDKDCNSHAMQQNVVHLLQHHLHDALRQRSMDKSVKGREVRQLADDAFKGSAAFSLEVFTGCPIPLKADQDWQYACVWDRLERHCRVSVEYNWSMHVQQTVLQP